ncbi:MAG TPA: 30S ribosomal protein S12 methylthiotransferase RimO [Fibrobacteria bacterium]|nr:30S ribosomal protein S12 methylthiotransferase RimO [Fibrobacteria bacterium]
MRAPSIHVVNLGCSKNLVDTERIYGDFLTAGFRASEFPEQASLVVVNTCGFIEAAKEESVNEILARVAERSEGQKILVAGCLSQRYLEDLRAEIPEVDLWTGTYQPGELVAKVRAAAWGLQPECSSEVRVPRLLAKGVHHAYVKISEGCDRVCSFCAIPGMRGKHVSRTTEEIVEDIRDLSRQGIREAVLIAQDLTWWGKDLGSGNSLSGLLGRILSETDMEWIRLTYAYPQFVDDKLLDLMDNSGRICRYLDMPLQHGSERMLKAMRRGHNRQSLRELLSRIRAGVPGIALRTTFLLGFPGETEEDVAELMDLVEETRFDRLGGFTYSPEEGTHGFDLPGVVDPEVAQDRLARLMRRQSEISLELNEARVGSVLKVLVEGVAEGRSHRFDARTEFDAPEVDNSVQILDGDAEPGTFATVRVVGATEYDLEAVVE